MSDKLITLENLKKYDNKLKEYIDNNATSGIAVSFKPTEWDPSEGFPTDVNKVYSVKKDVTVDKTCNRVINISKDDLIKFEQGTSVAYIYEGTYTSTYYKPKKVFLTIGEVTVESSYDASTKETYLSWFEDVYSRIGNYIELVFYFETNKIKLVIGNNQTEVSPEDSYEFNIEEVYSQKYSKGELIVFNGFEWVKIANKEDMRINYIQATNGASSIDLSNNKIQSGVLGSTNSSTSELTLDKSELTFNKTDGSTTYYIKSKDSMYYGVYSDINDDRTIYLSMNQNEYGDEEGSQSLTLGIAGNSNIEVTDDTINLNATNVKINNKSIPTVTDTYSGTSSDAMSGKAIASALGTQVTYTLSGTTLYINAK